jgi:hypothetical protein
MIRQLVPAAMLSLFLAGCGGATTQSNAPPTNDGAVKVRAPGVNVDIQKGDKKKVDVEVNR